MKSKSYYQERLGQLGVKENEIQIDLLAYNSGHGEYKVTVPAFREDNNGNIAILLYGLDRKIFYTDHPLATPDKVNSYNDKSSPAEILRYKIPREFKKDNNVVSMKYKSPKNMESKPYFPELILQKYEARETISTLVLTEGQFKAFAACRAGIPCVGLQGIQNLKSKRTGAMFADVIKIIETCNVQNVIMLYDGDCCNISAKSLEKKHDLVKRPNDFFQSISTVRELLKDFAVDVYWASLRISEFENQAKAIDDAICELKFESQPLVEDLLQLSKSARYFDRFNVSRSLNKVAEFLCVRNVDSFYEAHREQIGMRDFMFRGTMYQYNVAEEKLQPLLKRDVSNFCRVGDDYWETILVPNQYGKLDERLVRRLKTTISDDFGSEAFAQIQKYKSFCNVPDHLNYNKVIHDCFNLYNPFTHSATHGDCSLSLAFVKHIFGEYFEMGLDYMQLLLTKPTVFLPVLCLVSKENKTGKSTFAKWLREIFQNNTIFVSSDDFGADFNFHWAGKLLIVCEETELTKSNVMDRIKSLSTNDKITMNRKGRDHEQIDFFAKFVLCSNNEEKFLRLDKFAQRFWVLKVNPFQDFIHDFDNQLYSEIPHFLHFLYNRQLLYPKSMDRMWFPESAYKTKAFEAAVRANRSRVEVELEHFLQSVWTEYEYADIYEDEPAFFIGFDYIRKIMFKEKYDAGTIKYYLSFMPHSRRVNSAGEAVSFRCKVPRWNNDYVEELNNKLEFDNYVCKPYVFFAKDFLEENEYKTLKEKVGLEKAF